jgi:hypothetical protein
VLARIALEANFVGFATIVLKRVIGIVLLFGFIFCFIALAFYLTWPGRDQGLGTGE